MYDPIIMGYVVRDFKAYLQIKYGEDWENHLAEILYKRPKTTVRLIKNWFNVWKMRWRQRVALVSKFPEQRMPHPTVKLSAKEKDELVKYIQEELAKRGEFAAIEMVAQGIVRTALAMFEKRDRPSTDRISFLQLLMRETNRVMDALLTPTSKILLINISQLAYKLSQL
jgi:hypothetical protein